MSYKSVKKLMECKDWGNMMSSPYYWDPEDVPGCFKHCENQPGCVSFTIDRFNGACYLWLTKCGYWRRQSGIWDYYEMTPKKKLEILILL